MLESLFGSVNRERVLIFISARGEGYAREIADFYDTDLSPIQNQLDRLEAGNIFISKKQGKTRVYQYNPRFPFLKQLRAFIDKVIEFLPEKERERLVMVRKRPRRKGKPL